MTSRQKRSHRPLLLFLLVTGAGVALLIPNRSGIQSLVDQMSGTMVVVHPQSCTCTPYYILSSRKPLLRSMVSSGSAPALDTSAIARDVELTGSLPDLPIPDLYDHTYILDVAAVDTTADQNNPDEHRTIFKLKVAGWCKADGDLNDLGLLLAILAGILLIARVPSLLLYAIGYWTKHASSRTT